MITRLNAPITGYKSGLVPLDVDVFPQDNSNTKKEGVNRTFKNYAGEGKRIDTILVEAYNKVEETPSTFQ